MRYFWLLILLGLLSGCSGRAVSTPAPSIMFSGEGDAKFDLPDTLPMPALMRIVGSSLIIHIVFDFDGLRVPKPLILIGGPQNVLRLLHYGRRAVGLEVKTTKPWQIEILPGLEAAHKLRKSGKITGIGSDVVWVEQPCDLRIERHGAGVFSVLGIGDGIEDLLVNTTKEFSGVVPLNPSIAVLDVDADFPWEFSCS